MEIIDARILIKQDTTAGQVPTVAPSADHLDGSWDKNDIYKSELFANTADSLLWMRTDDGIMQIPFIKDIQANAYNSGTAAGTDTYTLSLTPNLTEYTNGNLFVVTFTNANTGAATLNVDSLGAKNIKSNGSALSSGDIGAGKTYLLAYDGTEFEIYGVGGAGGGITNSAANNYVTKSDGTNVVQSQIYDNGTFVGVNSATQTAAAERLLVNVTSGNYGLVHSDGTRIGGTYSDATGLWFGTYSNHDLIFFTNNASTPFILRTSGDAEFENNIIMANGTGTNGKIIFEGSTADAYETTLVVADPTADRTITLPDATGTVALTSNVVKFPIVKSWDGQGATVTTGNTRYFTAPYAMTITGWNISAVGSSPTCTIDIWKIASGTSLPTVSNTIMGTKPALSSGNAVRSSTMTGWTTLSIAAGDILGFNIDACSNGTVINFELEVE